MASNLFVVARLTPSGSLELIVGQEKRGLDIYVGRIATRHNVINVYAKMTLSAVDEMALMGRVARWIVINGGVDDVYGV